MTLQYEAPNPFDPELSAETTPVTEMFSATAEASVDPTVPAIDKTFAADARIAIVNSYAEAIMPAVPVIENEAPELFLVPAIAEKAKAPKFTLREATLADIDDIVDVDMRSFDSVYTGYEQDQKTLRAELTEKFRGRYDKVGGEWMPVLERDGKIVGFMTCCPTNKTPEDFVSWEETTDNGTLNNTYDPHGKNVYVVTLSVVDEGKAGKDMLYANQIGKLLKEGFNLGFFESRLPGARDWVVANKCGGDEAGVDSLDDATKLAYVEEYFDTYTERKGKRVREDRLIRLYESIGCRCEMLLPDAYQDEPSMNFGVMCIYDGSKLFDGSDIPFKIPNNRATRWVFGSLMKGAARSQKIVSKLF